MRAILIPSLAAVAISGCGPPPLPFHPIADNKVLMRSVMEPAADRIWNAVGSVVTLEGVEEIRPTTDEEWTALGNAAITLAETGNLLMIAPRAQDGEAWNRLSRDLIDSTETAVRAIEAKDLDRIFDAGGEIYAVCSECHSQYAVEIAR